MSCKQVVQFSLMFVILLLAGTGCVKKTPVDAMLPAFPMTKAEAIHRLEQISHDSQGIQSINAKVTVQAKIVTVQAKTGGVRTATLSTSPQLDGTLLLQRPDHIRLRAKIAMGLATAFDLVSDGRKYQFLIPEKKQLWEGKEDGPPVGPISDNPMINSFVSLRPKQVQDAVLINVLPLVESTASQIFVERVAVRQELKYYYVVLFTMGSGTDSRIVEKIWFDLSTEKLVVARRQTFRDNGEIDADVLYTGWGVPKGTGISIPSKIQIEFPDREIVLTITIDPQTAVLNGKLAGRAFDLEPGDVEIKSLPTKAP